MVKGNNKKEEVNKFGVVEGFIFTKKRKNIKQLDAKKFTDLIA